MLEGGFARMPAAEDAGISEVLETPGLIDRREAVAERGAGLRELIDAAMRTEASPDVLRRAAAAVARRTLARAGAVA